MRKSSLAFAGVVVLALVNGAVCAQEAHEDEDHTELLAALQNTPHSLLAGIEQVAVGTEVPIESKFEMEDGVLKLSVYTSEKGLETIAEENVFKEYKGDATQATWAPKTEVFEDFQHIARSAQYHTLLSMTDVTIPDVIAAASDRGAMVFSVKLKVVNGKPGFEVISAAPSGQAVETFYDLATGFPVEGVEGAVSTEGNEVDAAPPAPTDEAVEADVDAASPPSSPEGAETAEEPENDEAPADPTPQ